MTFLLKDPDAVLDYSVDWSAEYLLEDQIAASAWSALALRRSDAASRQHR